MWNIKPEAKYYKYAKESELHHGRVAMLAMMNLNMNPLLLFELARLCCIEKPFIIKENHYLGNYFGLNMNNKYVVIKIEICIARLACLYILYDYLKTFVY
jgi:hypothetical protein